MKMEIEAFLHVGDETTVSVFLGSLHLGEIPAVSESRAGHGDDSSYFRSEEERIIAESIRDWVAARLLQ